MNKLTDKQKQILDFIRETMIERSAPPTLREIGRQFNISSTNGVRSFLTALEKKGAIKRSAFKARGIELADGALTPASFNSVPLIGRVAAGMPVLAEENLEGRIGIDRSLLGGEGLFALKVQGDSMIEAGIFDGDLVFARQTAEPGRGDIVVAIIGDEATVKYFYPENGRIRLEPANPGFRTIVVEKNTPDFSIAGKVVGMFRNYEHRRGF